MAGEGNFRRRAAAAALAGLVGLQTVAGSAIAATPPSRTKDRCGTLQRRYEARLRHALPACSRAGSTLAVLGCAHARRAVQGGALVGRGCPAPWWMVKVQTKAIGKDRVAVTWESGTNWARLLDRQDDPIASTVRRADNRFENLLVLDASVDLAAVTSYIEDVEVRQNPGAGGFLPGLPGGTGGVRAAFPIPTGGDRSIDETVDRMNAVIASCAQSAGTSYGGSSMFAEGDGTTFSGAMEGIKSHAQASKDFSAEPGGNHGQAFAYLVADILEKVFGDDKSSDPPPADDTSDDDSNDQCTETDGSCPDGTDDNGDQQSTDGKDDPQTDPTPAPAPQAPAAGSASMPGSDDGAPTSCGDGRATMEQIEADCGQMHWQTSLCQAVVRFTNGCEDSRVINPGPEGDVPCTGEGMSQDEYFDLQCQQRGRIAQPGPDGQTMCARPGDLTAAQSDPRVLNDPCNDPRANVTDCDDGNGGAVVAPTNSPLGGPRPVDPGPGSPRGGTPLH